MSFSLSDISSQSDKTLYKEAKHTHCKKDTLQHVEDITHPALKTTPKIPRPKGPKTLKQWGKLAKTPQDAGRETGFLSIGSSSENKGITNSETWTEKASVRKPMEEVDDLQNGTKLLAVSDRR